VEPFKSVQLSDSLKISKKENLNKQTITSQKERKWYGLSKAQEEKPMRKW
jgi:hypothetical protein